MRPYYERAGVTISVSGGSGVDYWSYLLDVDTIFRHPHWGKLHFNRAEDMPSLYRRFHDFQAIRGKIDSSGCFLNDHLRNLFLFDEGSRRSTFSQMSLCSPRRAPSPPFRARGIVRHW